MRWQTLCQASPASPPGLWHIPSLAAEGAQFSPGLSLESRPGKGFSLPASSWSSTAQCACSDLELCTCPGPLLAYPITRLEGA